MAVIALSLRVDAWISSPSSSPARSTATLYGHAKRMPMPRRARAARPQLVTRAEGTDDEERDEAPATAGAYEPQFVGDLVREEEPPPSIMQAAAQAKVSGIVLIAAVAGSASLPDNVKPALLAIAALSGTWTLWKIQPVLKAVQAQVQAESTTPASNESGFDPFDPSTAQFIGTVSASPAAPATTSLQHHQHHRKPAQPRRTPSRLYCSCTAYTSLPPPSISKQPAATFGASAGTRHMRAGACICSFA